MKLKEVKRKDIIDVPGSDGFSLMLDDRIKAHNFFYKQYPYTVEFSDEVDTRNYINLETWQPVEGFHLAVEWSRFVINMPGSIKLRYKELNLAQQVKISGNKYEWELKQYKPLRNDFFVPDFSAITPAVHASAEAFSYAGYKGKLDSWLNYGQFLIDLNKGRDELPEEIRAAVHQLTDGIADPKERVKILYEYLQKNTRYISIQLGIGGFQPFEAKFVAEKKYGDCKALSNYMVALLKEAGVTGYYSIIRAGEDKKFYLPDFVSNQSNHIIVCVPLQKDTIWLECTSQDVAMGYLGKFTDDRYALLIKEDGGHLVKTPRYTAEQNYSGRKVMAQLNDKGGLYAEISTTYKGLEQDDMFRYLHYLTKEELDKKMNTIYDFPTYKVTSHSIQEMKDIIPSIHCDMKIDVSNYANVSGKRIFIKPNLIEKSSRKLDTSTARVFDIAYPYSFINDDTVIITMPPGYEPEAIPKNINEKNKFGEYSIRYIVEENTIKVHRHYRREQGNFPASDFKALSVFYDLIFKADHSQAVFVKKEGIQ